MRTLAAAVAMLLVGACTTIGPAPTTAPTAAPTATPGSTPSPTTAPTAPSSPSPSPSQSATAALTASPTGVPATSPPATTGPIPTATATAPVSPGVDALLAHVPAAFRQDCNEVTSFDGGFIVGVSCMNIPDVDGYVTYYQFDTVDNMNASYASNVGFFGVGADGSSCQQEPSEGSYTISGTPSGRVMCNDYDNGIIGYWTHEGFAIESSIVLFAGTYADWYGVWQMAGPDPADPSATASPASGFTPIDWTTSASEHDGQTGERFRYACPPGGSTSVAYGTDVYTSDSFICTAAVHAGLITAAAGGSVTIEMRAGQDSYVGSERNGVTTYSWGSWNDSFVFVTP